MAEDWGHGIRALRRPSVFRLIPLTRGFASAGCTPAWATMELNHAANRVSDGPLHRLGSCPCQALFKSMMQGKQVIMGILLAILALFAFGIAAIVGIAAIPGITIMTVAGIIAVGLALLTLAWAVEGMPKITLHR